MKKTMAWILALLMLSFPLAACSADTADDGTKGAVSGNASGENADAASTPEAETTYSRENYPDDLPSTLNFNGAAFRMCMRGSWDKKEFGSGIRLML